MSQQTSHFKLGLFIVTGTALFVVMAVLFGAGVFKEQGIIIETYVDSSVQGLEVGSPLKYRGVQVGEVTSIDLVGDFYGIKDSRHARYVMVVMELEPREAKTSRNETILGEVLSMVEAGLRIRLTSSGITGGSYMEADYIDLEFDEPLDVTWTPKYIYVPSAPAQLAMVFDSIESIARDLQRSNITQIAANIETLLENLNHKVEEAEIASISAQIDRTLVSVESVVASVGNVVNDDTTIELRDNLLSSSEDLASVLHEAKGTLQDARTRFNATMDQLATITSQVEGQLGSDEIQELLTRASRISDSVVNTIQTLDSTLSRAELALTDNGGNLQAVTDNLKGATEDIRRLLDLIARYPSLAAFGEAPTPAKAYDND